MSGIGGRHVHLSLAEASGLSTDQIAFSSSSGLFGVPGQSTYAAGLALSERPGSAACEHGFPGNTFVDAVMPSIQWGGRPCLEATEGSRQDGEW